MPVDGKIGPFEPGDQVGDGTNYFELEADGSIKFTGTAGLAFGCIYVKDSVATIVVDSDVADVLVTQWTTNGLSNNCTPDAANNKITITETGIYLVIFASSVDLDAGAAVELHLDGYLNGVVQPALHANRTISSTDIGSMSFNGIIDVTSVPWDIDIRGNINSATARNLEVEDAQLTIVQIGGT